MECSYYGNVAVIRRITGLGQPGTAKRESHRTDDSETED